MRKRFGFTLIELLVVIAIILILAAILFPVFASVRSKAKQAACINNLKQIGVAIELYCQDSNSCLPWPTFLSRFTAQWVVEGHRQANYISWRSDTWVFLDEMLAPYAKSEAIFYCPANVEREQINWHMTKMTFGENKGGYIYNTQVPPTTEIGSRDVVMVAGQPIESFPRPSLLALVWDIRHWGVQNDYNVEPPHFGGLNVLYADMHVKRVSLEAQSGIIGSLSFWRTDSWQGAYRE